MARIAVSRMTSDFRRWPAAILPSAILSGGWPARAATDSAVTDGTSFLLPLGLGAAFLVATAISISARRALARAAASRDLVNDAMDAVPHARVIIAPDGRAVQSNQVWKRMAGPDEAVPLASLEAALADDESRDRFKRLQEAAAAGTRAESDLQVRLPSGGTEWRATAVYPMENRPGYALWGIEDTAARHDAEQVVREEQARLVDLMENAPIGFYSVDGDGKFLFINDTLAEWLGHTPRDITSGAMRLHDFIAAGDLSRCDPFSPFPKGADESHGEVTLKGRGNRPFQAYISQTVVRGENGDGARTRCLVRDLTAERESAEALSESEQRFRRFFEEAPVGIVLLDSEGKVIECSAAFADMVHGEHGNMTGREFTEFVGGDNRAEVTQWLADGLCR